MTRSLHSKLLTIVFTFLIGAFVYSGLNSPAAANTDQSAIQSVEYYPAATEMEIPKYFTDDWDYYRLHSVFDPEPYTKSDQNDKDLETSEVQSTLHNGDRMTITYDNGDKKSYYAKTFIDPNFAGAGSGEYLYMIVWYDEDGNTTNITTNYRSDVFWFIMEKEKYDDIFPRTAGIKEDLVQVDVQEPYRGSTSCFYDMKFNITGKNDVLDQKKLDPKDIQLRMNSSYTSELQIKSSALKSDQLLKLNVIPQGSRNFYNDYYIGKKFNLYPEQGSLLILTLNRFVEHVSEGYYSYSKPTVIHCLFDRNDSVKVKSGKKKLKVSWSKVNKASGYEIMYSKKKNMKKARTIKIRGGKKTRKTIKKLAKNKTYYVKVRPYKVYKGKTFKGFYSEKLSVKTNIVSSNSVVMKPAN